MSKKRFAKVSVSIWNDGKFQGLSTEAKLIFLFLLTTQLKTLLGLVPVHKEAIAKACGLSKRQGGKGFEELLQQGMIEYDEVGLVWLRNFFKHSGPDNSNVVSAWPAASDLCPECDLKEKVLVVAGEHCLARGAQFVKAFLKGFPDYCPGMGIGNGSVDGSPIKEKREEQKEKTEEDLTTVRIRFPYHALPTQWRNLCEKLRPDLDPNFIFEKLLKHYSTAAKHEERTASQWTETWIGWLKKERI